MKTFQSFAKCFALISALLAASAASQANASPSCPDADMFLATTPAPYRNPKAIEKYWNKISLIQGKVDIVIAGDSIAAGWPNWLFQQVFPGKKIYNIAVGGARTESALWGLQSDRLSVLQPEDVVIVLGTNNLPNTQDCAIVAGMDLVVKRMLAIWPQAHIHLFGIFPRGNDFKFRDAQRNAANQGYRTLAATHSGMSYLDADAELACPNPVTCEYYKPDRLHLLPPGYRAIGTVLAHQGH